MYVQMLNSISIFKAKMLKKNSFPIAVNDADYSVPHDVDQVVHPSKSVSASIQKYNTGLVSLKEFANDSNFANVAASIDFEEIIKNIERNNEFVTLTEEPKTYDVVGFKVICVSVQFSLQLK